MDRLTRDADMIPCPHCGLPVRRGMIRCRECNGILNEDFELADNVAITESTVRRCVHCGDPIPDDLEDCPQCASDLLDRLLISRPETESRPARSSPSGSRSTEVPARRSGDSVTPIPKNRERRQPDKERRAARRPAAQAVDSDQDGTEALYEQKPEPAPARSRRAAAEAEPESTEPAEGAASEACQSLLAALTTTDPAALSQVVAALGQLGDRQASGALERLMGHPEIQVRRATAEALILLGHPKGNALREIAERRVAAPPPAAKGAAKSKSRAARAPIDWGSLLKPGLALVAAAAIGGGIWWWQSRPATSSKRLKGKKSGYSKKTTAPAGPKATPQPNPGPAVPPQFQGDN